MSISDMAEKPAQENAQSVEINIVKKKKREESGRASLVRKQTGGTSESPTDPKKGRAKNQNTHYSGYPSDALTVDKNIHECMATDESQIGCKIITDKSLIYKL